MTGGKARVDEVLKNRRELEGEIDGIGQSIIKFENQKLKVKTNQEYTALNSEIAHVKERRSGLEDQVLVSFDDEELAVEKVKNLQAKLTEAVARTEARQKELETRSAGDKARLEELKARREELAALMAKPLLSKYESIRTRKVGTAVVSVENGVCGGCFSALPPQTVNEVKKRDKVHSCEFCGRFLVHEADLGE